MSDTSRPRRIGVLESSVGEMRAELSHTRAQIEQIMGMMLQLFQAKSAGRGQQEETSGGSGREDANDDSGGGGRAPREEGVTGTRVGATIIAAERGKMSIHSSRESDRSRPADDTGRRPEIPPGVGPMINTQCVKAGDSYFSLVTVVMEFEFRLSNTAPCCPTYAER